MFFYIICMEILSGFISWTIRFQFSKFFSYASFFTLSTITIRKSSDNHKNKCENYSKQNKPEFATALYHQKLIAKINLRRVVYFNHQKRYCNSSWILSCILGILDVPIHIKNCLDWQLSLGYRFNFPFI